MPADHPITLTQAPNRWRARFAGHVIADTDHAILLREASYPQVVYFPKADVEMAYFGKTDRRTTCPHKGEASYWTLDMEGRVEDNVAWAYETPYPAMADIAGHIAFYADRVEIYEVSGAAVNPQHREDREPEDRAADRESIDDVVLHTDSGSGASQREHWPSNVDGPGPDGGVR